MSVINICFASDKNLYTQLIVAVSSILENSKNSDEFKFFILGNKFSNRSKKIFDSLKKIKEFSVEFIETKTPIFKIASLLPKNIDKVLYLNCDTITLGSLEDAYETDFQGKHIAAVEDAYSVFHSEKLKLSKKHKYFNRGVILFNLKALRETNFETKCLEYSNKNQNKDELSQQDILNIIFENKCKYLPLRWNTNGNIAIDNILPNKYSEEELQKAIEKPAILHFTAADKPWILTRKNYAKKLYFELLSNVPSKLFILGGDLDAFFKTIKKLFEKRKQTPKNKKNSNPININVCYASDNNYAQHVAVSISSILQNGNNCNNYYFGIMDGGISDYNKKKINSFQKRKNVRVEFFEMDQDDFKECPITNYVDYITTPTYYRFKIASTFPDFDKILYLDCDTIIRKDIAELFETDISECYLASVPEIYNQYQKSRLEIEKDDHYYVNAGVLLINLKKWREDNIEKKLFEYAKNPEREIVFQDQDIINEVLKYNLKYLNVKWNLQHSAIHHKKSYIYHYEERIIAAFDPSIVHFTHYYKPWDTRCENLYKYEYAKYLKYTAYLGAYLAMELKQKLSKMEMGAFISWLSKLKSAILH